MTTTEFWLAWLFNLRGVMQVGAIVMLVLSVAAMFVWLMMQDIGEDEKSGAAKGVMKISIPSVIVLSMLASAPGVEDLWKLRIGLLKLELVSPENLKGLQDHAEKIVSTLECKYLQVNCETTNKESK